MHKHLFLALGIGVGVVLASIAYSHNLRNTQKDIVYVICQESRMGSTISEQGCGDLQDRLKVEYLCKDRNPYPTNVCWTE